MGRLLNASGREVWWGSRADSWQMSSVLVVPRGQEGASFADREVAHPLRLVVSAFVFNCHRALKATPLSVERM